MITKQRAAIEAHVEDHKSKLIEVPNQMAYGTNPDLKVCCDPDSKEKILCFQNVHAILKTFRTFLYARPFSHSPEF